MPSISPRRAISDPGAENIISRHPGGISPISPEWLLQRIFYLASVMGKATAMSSCWKMKTTYFRVLGRVEVGGDQEEDM